MEPNATCSRQGGYLLDIPNTPSSLQKALIRMAYRGPFGSSLLFHVERKRSSAVLETGSATFNHEGCPAVRLHTVYDR